MKIKILLVVLGLNGVVFGASSVITSECTPAKCPDSYFESKNIVAGSTEMGRISEFKVSKKSDLYISLPKSSQEKSGDYCLDKVEDIYLWNRYEKELKPAKTICFRITNP